MSRYQKHKRNQAIKTWLAAVPLIIMVTFLLGTLFLGVLNSISPLPF